MTEHNTSAATGAPQADPTIMTPELQKALDDFRLAEERLMAGSLLRRRDTVGWIELDAYELKQMAGIAERLVETMFSDGRNGVVNTTTVDRDQITFAVQEVFRRVEALHEKLDYLAKIFDGEFSCVRVHGDFP